jgi:hypothetical protein
MTVVEERKRLRSAKGGKSPFTAAESVSLPTDYRAS